jgi:hypothetical protein
LVIVEVARHHVLLRIARALTLSAAAFEVQNAWQAAQAASFAIRADEIVDHGKRDAQA